MLQLGTRIKLDAKQVHPCWSEEERTLWCSHEGVVIGYGLPDEKGTILQIAWSKGCNHTLHIHEHAVVVVGGTSYEDQLRNMNSVYFDRSDFKDILATPPLGKWRCTKA